jgi:hypothetical protein
VGRRAMTDAEVDFVINHPVALICAGLLGTPINGQRPERRITPAQLERVGRRLWSWRTAGSGKFTDEARAMVRQAEELANPQARMSDAEVERVLASPALVVLCAAPGWQAAAAALSAYQVERIGTALREIAGIHSRMAEMLNVEADRRERT